MSNLPTSDEASSGHKERRAGPRATPDPFLFIRLPGGNQGVVFDVSHEGVGFLASAAIEDAQTIRFEISDRSMPGYVATGQLMWKDSAGKRGGLRFTHVPEELRSVISTFIPREQFSAASRFEPKASGGKSLESVPLEIEVPEQEESPETDSLASRIYSGIWSATANTFTVALACVIVLAIWYSVDRRDAVDSFSRLKREVSAPLLMRMESVHLGSGHYLGRVPQWWWARWAKKKQTPLASAAVSVTAAAPTIASDAPAEAAIPEGQKPVPAAIASTPEIAESPVAPPPAAAESSTDNADAHPSALASSPVPVLPSALAVKDTGLSELTSARKLLQDSNPTSNAQAAQLLWQAVKKGNVAAEAELGGLYLAGHAVPKSCSQAIVLLSAARSHKNAAAAEKLGGLAQYDCASPIDSPSPASSESLTPTP